MKRSRIFGCAGTRREWFPRPTGVLFALGLVAAAPASAQITVSTARIGCLDIQRSGNLNGLVGRACDGKLSCSYKAPTPTQYQQAGVSAATRSFCTQAMEIIYHCKGDKQRRKVTVPGDAWGRPPAALSCPRPAASSAAAGTAQASRSTSGIRVSAARIGCLDIQKKGNLTAVVGRACDGKKRCDYKAPTPAQYQQMGVSAATRSLCTQAMEIKYTCPTGERKVAFVNGDAWGHPPALMTCGDGGSKVIAFDHDMYGFKFANTFLNIFTKEIVTGGLCGGMSYAALDYYLAKQATPRQDFRPANGTELQQYLYFRQVHSLERNLDKWGELVLDGEQVRGSEFFRWGLQGFAGGRLQELIAAIDRGRPVPLGLLHHKSGHGGDHQVLALGYRLRRFTGTDWKHPFFGDHAEDLEILVRDPNYPDRGTLTLTPDTGLQGFYYRELGKNRPLYRTYFVDNRYSAAKPPSISEIALGNDDKVRELQVEVGTVDDLPGGSQNLDVVVDYVSHPDQVVKNINSGQRWLGNYEETVPIKLRYAVDPDEINGITLIMTGGGRMRIRCLKWRVLGSKGKTDLYSRGNPSRGSPAVFEFTRSNNTLSAASKLKRSEPAISIVSARYGENCGLRAPASDITRSVARDCSRGGSRCRYTQTWEPWGGSDPSPSLCKKEIDIRYKCGGATQSTKVLHTTTPQQVDLVCL